MGLTIDAVLALPDREVQRWRRYWNEEPWGAYRDNLHAAVLAVQILRPHLKQGAKVPTLDKFMLRIPEAIPDAKRANALAFLTTLKAIARKVPR